MPLHYEYIRLILLLMFELIPDNEKTFFPSSRSIFIIESRVMRLQSIYNGFLAVWGHCNVAFTCHKYYNIFIYKKRQIYFSIKYTSSNWFISAAPLKALILMLWVTVSGVYSYITLQSRRRDRVGIDSVSRNWPEAGNKILLDSMRNATASWL